LRVTFYFFVVFVFCHSVFARGWQDIYKSSTPSIPILYSDGGICTGALIEKDLILTAWHCVSKFRNNYISWSLESEKYSRAEIVAINKKVDLALLKLNKSVSRPVLKLLPKIISLEEGQSIATIGHPLARKKLFKSKRKTLQPSLSHILSQGIVSRVQDHLIVTDLSMSPGNSGGPILDIKGRIVGVASRKLVGMSIGNIGYFISHKEVHDFLEKYKKNDSKRPDLLNADTNFGLRIIFYSNHRFLNDIGSKDHTLNGLDYHIDFYDRLRLQYETSFSSTPSYHANSIGFVFKYDFAPQTTVTVVPAYGSIRYSPGNTSRVTEHFTSLTLEGPMSAFFVRGTYIFGFDEEKTILTFGLKLF